jgi:short-subunit dehydrogenase
MEQRKDEGMNWSNGKHALITGASSGIGRELAQALEGSCRRITSVSRTHGMNINNQTTMRLEIEDIYVDDQIDLFINCAGGSHIYAPFEQMSDEDIAQIFDTNARAPLFLLHELLPRMKTNTFTGEKRAHVILLSSRSAERSLPNLSVYSAAKGAIERLCESLRLEYAQYRIAFTLVNPGSINTGFTNGWSQETRDAHNAEAMSVEEAVKPILAAIDSEYATNKISYESIRQWMGEPGVVK